MAVGLSFGPLLLLLVTSGGTPDIAGLIGTEAYWRHTQQATPEVDELIEIASAQAAAEAAPLASSARRVMAIRTLAQQKADAAMPVLKELRSSDQPVIAYEAKSALARLEGSPAPAGDLARAEFDADLAMLPAGAQAVAQFHATAGDMPSFRELMQQTGMLDTMPDQGEELRDRATEQFIHVFEQKGNIRIDAVTLGITGNPDGPGAAVVVLHGLYDPDTISRALLAADFQQREVDGRLYYETIDLSIALLSPRRAFLVAAEDDEPREAALAHTLAAAKKAGKPTHFDKLLTKRIKQARGENSRLWAAALLQGNLLPPNPQTDAFESVTFTRHTGDEGALELHVRLFGSDDHQAAKIEMQIDGFRSVVLRQLEQHGD